MPSAVMPNSQSMPQPDNAGPPQAGRPGAGNGVPAGKPGGTIMISRSEAAALTALETDDPKIAFKRAKEESGLDDNQLRKLQARARRARSGGFTLKSGTLTLAPTNHPEEAPEDQGLLRSKISKDGQPIGDDDDEPVSHSTAVRPKPGGKSAKAAAAKPAAKKTNKAREAAWAAVEAGIESVLHENDTVFDVLTEKWSDAARAAAAAGRRSRSKGGSKNAWKDAARNAYASHGGSPESEKSAIATIKKKSAERVGRQNIPGAGALGMRGIQSQMRANAAATGRNQLAKKVTRFGHDFERNRTKSVSKVRNRLKRYAAA